VRVAAGGTVEAGDDEAVSVRVIRGWLRKVLVKELSGGETRDRTGDTTIFNRVLYQLSYLATSRKERAVKAGKPGP